MQVKFLTIIKYLSKQSKTDNSNTKIHFIKTNKPQVLAFPSAYPARDADGFCR